MAERTKSVAAYLKELRDAELTEMTMDEMHSHIRARIRANKADQEQTRFAMTMLEMMTTKAATEKKIADMNDELPGLQKQLDIDKESMIAKHRRELADQMREETEKFHVELEAERKKHKESINKLMAYTKSVSDELRGEVDAAKKAADTARTDKQKLDREAGDLGRRIASLKLELANAEKESKRAVENLRSEEEIIRGNINAMKAERDAFLKQFGAKV